MRRGSKRSVRRLRQTLADQILQDVALRHSMTVETLTAPIRSQRIVVARQEAMYLMRLHTGLTLKRIAERVGLRDHKTVHHGVKRHRARLESRGNG